MRHSGALLASVAIIAIALMQVEAVRESYKIKPYPIDNLGKALNLLRRFMPSRLSQAERCERFAILLQDIKGASQFSIAELGISPERAGFKQLVDVEELRDLYINAIEELRKEHLDQSLLELAECLRTKYWTVDAEARSFLNNADMKKLLEQYRSVVDSPMSILVDDEAKHSELTAGDLDPAVKRTLTNLYNGDEAKLEQHFPAPETEPEKEPEQEPVPESEPEEEAQVAATAYADAYNGGAQAGASVGNNEDGTGAQAGAQVDAQGGEAAAVANADGRNAAAQAFADQQGGAASAVAFGQTKDGGASAGAVAGTPKPQAQAQPEPQADEQQQPGTNIELTAEEQDFLNDVRTNLVALFDGLPEDSELPDRCFAYSQITSGEETELKNSNRAQGIVEQVKSSLASRAQFQQEVGPFMPEKDVRESFLVVLDAYKPEELGEELYVDVLDCVAVWQEVDPDIRVYMQNHMYQPAAEQEVAPQ